MFDVPTLLARIPDEYKPMAAVGIGSFVLVSLVLFHGCGLHLIFIRQKRRERSLLLGRPNLAAGALLFGWSVFLMLFLHVIEIVIWSFVITHAGIVKHSYDAIYFCANAYTTLGMGNLDVDKHWRNISPIIGITGLFTFAWTTSAGRRGPLKRSTPRTTGGRTRTRDAHAFRPAKRGMDALKTERDDALSEREKTRTQLSGLSFFERRKLWREERKREEELRITARAKIKELRLKERQEEEKLGPGTPPDAKDNGPK